MSKIDKEAKRINQSIGNLIKELREDAKMSQRDLARAVGVNQSTIHRIENGNYGVYSIDFLLKIFDVFGYGFELNFFALDEDE